MKRPGIFIGFLLVGLLAIPALLPAAHAQTSGPVVRAVLFYSPTCPHCHYVITVTLPPLIEKYGNRLQIIGVDVSQPKGQTLFLTALRKFGLEEGGVPFLVVGDAYLVGSLEIPQKFPDLIQTGLLHGGIDWPDIPGLAEVIPAEQVILTPAAIPTPQLGILLPDAQPAGWASNFSRDPLGNSLAVIVLVGMLASLGGAVIFMRRPPGRLPTLRSGWLMPVLCLLGLGVAGYLTFVETAHIQAVCGPVGDCNTVQQSEYSRLFGVLPIGVLGMVGYTMIPLVWFLGQFAGRQMMVLKDSAILGMATLGMLFSIYLTFLEPFVIGASCAWCLASSVVMTALFWLALPAVRRSILQD